MDNFYKIDRVLRNSRYPVPMARLCEVLEVSESTVQRTIRDMRNKMNAPIVRTRNPLGYRYSDEAYELPRLWFTTPESQSMLLLIKLIKALHPGLLDEGSVPMEKKLEGHLKAKGLPFDFGKRIRLLRSAARPVGPGFNKLASALLERRRIRLRYSARSTGERTEREVSPQRFTYYRDNWYVDVWCHLRNELRRLAVDRIEEPVPLDTPAFEVEEDVMNKQLDDGYGIFSGPAVFTAELLFTPAVAPWVSKEIWHPAQVGRMLESGEYLLQFSYSQPEELVLDILGYGPDVKVLGPAELRQEVVERLRAACAIYDKK